MHQGNDGTALGLIAGAGSLPIEVARLLRELGYSLFAIGFDGLTDRALESEVDDARWVRLGKLDAMAKAMQELGARRFILIGKVPKALIFDNRGIAEPDAEAIRLLAEERDRGDEPLMNAIARWIEGRGFQLCDQGEMLAPMLATVGPLSARSPSETELADLAIGLPIVQELGRLGIGQCVVVKQGSVLAVEAIEGTDSVIARALANSAARARLSSRRPVRGRTGVSICRPWVWGRSTRSALPERQGLPSKLDRR